jgi:hypothetical protein
MRKTFLIVTVTIASMVAAFVACTGGNTSKPVTTVISQDSLVKRGSYLVNAMGCDDCHSPKTFGPDGPQIVEEKRFSGHPSDVPLGKIDKAALKDWALFSHTLTAVAGPWGVSYAANISSDSTGIGAWTEQQFMTAIRKGLYKGLEGSRPLLPPMPWQMYRNLNDDDLRSIFAYLKSTKPVRNVVPAWIKMNEL